jgi:hypothetical protein
MRVNDGCYPHPVLGHSIDGQEDVTGVMFQAAVDPRFDQTAVFFDVRIDCSSSTLRRLIAERKAEYVIHVECGQTFCRHVERFATQHHSFVIAKDLLNGTVEVVPLVVAKEPIENYTIEGAHSDFSGILFSIAEGDFLAIGDAFTIDADITFDALQRVSSIMEVQVGNQADGEPLSVDFNFDKIIIRLSQADFRRFQLSQSNIALQEVAVCMLSLPVLTEAVRLVRDDSDQFSGNLRWHKILSAKIEEFGASKGMDPLEIAQRILESPLQRAFSMLAQQLEAE